MKLTTWLKERELNCRRLAAGKTGSDRAGWIDERSQRDHYWRPALKRLGIRWRKPYNTRHTYATTALMANPQPNPAYISRQMGHKSAKMLFQVYAKWIDGADRGRERDKINAAQKMAA